MWVILQFFVEFIDFIKQLKIKRFTYALSSLGMAGCIRVNSVISLARSMWLSSAIKYSFTRLRSTLFPFPLPVTLLQLMFMVRLKTAHSRRVWIQIRTSSNSVENEKKFWDVSYFFPVKLKPLGKILRISRQRVRLKCTKKRPDGGTF